MRFRVSISLALLTLIIVYVPLVPYSPNCWDKAFGVGPVVLAPAFRAEFTDYLRLFEVPYIRVGPVVLIRLWDWFADPEDWIINASNKSLYALVNPRDVDVTQLPPHIRDLIAQSEREHGRVWDTCELVRAVAIEGW